MITIPPVNDQSLEGVTRMEHEQLIPMMTKLPCHTQASEGMTIPYHTMAGYDQRDPDSDPPAQLRDGAGFLEAPDPPAPSHYNTKAPLTKHYSTLYNASQLFVQSFVSW